MWRMRTLRVRTEPEHVADVAKRVAVWVAVIADAIPVTGRRSSRHPTAIGRCLVSIARPGKKKKARKIRQSSEPGFRCVASEAGALSS